MEALEITLRADVSPIRKRCRLQPIMYVVSQIFLVTVSKVHLTVLLRQKGLEAILLLLYCIIGGVILGCLRYIF